MKQSLLLTVLTSGTIALGAIPFSFEISQANPVFSSLSSATILPSLTGQWVMGSLDPSPRVRQQLGKFGMSVTQNGYQLRVQPQIGIPLVGEISGQQVQVRLSDGQRVVGRISSDGNRVLLTRQGEKTATGVLVRVGSPECPNRGSWSSTIQSCSINR